MMVAAPRLCVLHNSAARVPAASECKVMMLIYGYTCIGLSLWAIVYSCSRQLCALPPHRVSCMLCMLKISIPRTSSNSKLGQTCDLSSPMLDEQSWEFVQCHPRSLGPDK